MQVFYCPLAVRFILHPGLTLLVRHLVALMVYYWFLSNSQSTAALRCKWKGPGAVDLSRLFVIERVSALYKQVLLETSTCQPSLRAGRNP